MNILARRYLFFALSLLVIVPGLVILVTKAVQKDLPLSIDFTGGSLLEVAYPSATPKPADIHLLYDQLDIQDVQVTTTDSGSFFIRSSFLDDAKRSEVLAAMEEEFNSEVTTLRFDSVGPSIGR